MTQNEPSTEAVERLVPVVINVVMRTYTRGTILDHEEAREAVRAVLAAHESTLRQHAERLADELMRARTVMNNAGYRNSNMLVEIDRINEIVGAYRADYPKDESNG